MCITEISLHACMVIFIVQITFDVVFHPKELSQDIRCDQVACHVEAQTEPLTLTLTGVCIEKVPIKEVSMFACLPVGAVTMFEIPKLVSRVKTKLWI